MNFQPRQTMTPRKFVLVASLLLAVLGVSVLLGWAFGVAALKSIFPGLATMKANTAAAILLCGVSLALLSRKKASKRIRRWVATLALLVIAVGAITLAEYLFGWEFRIDQALFRELAVSVAIPNPGRMSPSTALCFVFAGTALFVASLRYAWRWRWPILSALGAAVALLGAIALVAYLLDAFLYFHIWNYTGVAVHTAASFVLLGIGLLALVRSEGGLTWSIDASTTKGTLIGIASLLMVAVVSNNFTYRLQQDDLWVSHTQEVLKEIEAVAGGMVDLESAQRGYIITGDARLLEPRERTIDVVGADVKSLRFLTSDNPCQQRRLDQLEPLIIRRNDWGEQTITARKDGGFAAGERMIALRTGIALSSDITGLLREMRDEEYALLDRRRKQSAATSTTAFLLLPLGLFLSLAMLSLALFLLNAGISERAQAELVLRQQASLLDLAPVLVRDMDGRIVSWSSGVQKLYGFTKEEAQGRVSHELLRTEFPIPLTQIEQTLEAEGGWEGELRHRARDGSQMVVASQWVLYRAAQGKPGRILEVDTDITERVRAAEALRHSDARRMTALESAELGDWQIDLQTGQAARSLLHDRIFGYAEELPEWSFDIFIDHVHPEDRERVTKVYKEQLDQAKRWDFECRIVWPDQTIHWIWACGGPYKDRSGKTTHMMGTVADITVRKRAEAMQLRSQKLESLGTLSGGIAHDFNNILLAINGNTKLAVADLPPGHPVQQSLAAIAKAGSRAADLVRRILAFSRPQELKREVIQLQPVVEEALELVRTTLSAKVEIRTEFAPDLPPVVADATQIHQIVVNLATNAAHAIGPNSGVIEFQLNAMNVSEDHTVPSLNLSAGGYVHLKVSDNGCGMDRATSDRIFDPFFTTKGPAEGTGLGLSVVHGIIKNHGGAISVYSEAGRGTAFHLYFPASGNAVASAEPAPEIQPGRSEHILYVDDDDALVVLVTRMLQRLGYRVSGHTGATRALEQFRSSPRDFDAVVTDLSMPGMSGFEFARELLAIRPDTPIIMTSGYVRPEDQEKALTMGLRDLILKPDTIEQLGRTLDRIFQHEHSPDKPVSA
jgi:PAS domain S-box-containing protein